MIKIRKGGIWLKTGELAEAIREKISRIAIVLLCAMVVGASFNSALLTNLFHYPVATANNSNYSRVADPNTMEAYLNPNVLGIAENSRYAGRIWTDKTVFALGRTSDSFNGTFLQLDANKDGSRLQVSTNTDFLHVFSALGSSQVVNQETSKPIDVVLLLDISRSMTGVEDHLQELMTEANTLIKQLMGDDPNHKVHADNRVGVVVYGGGAQTLLPLNHYQSSNNGNYIKIGNKTDSSNSTYFAEITTTVKETNGFQNTSSKVMLADSTYLQGALALGMGMLATEKDTTYYDSITKTTQPRTPVVIVLTDGATNIISANSTSNGGNTRYNDWWNPMTGVIAHAGEGMNYAVGGANPFYADCNETTGNGTETGRNSKENKNIEIQAIAPRTVSNLLLAGYYKKKIQANYKTSMLGFSIGYNIGGLGTYANEQLLATMNPKTYFGERTDVTSLAQNEINATKNTLESYFKGDSPAMRFPRNEKDKYTYVSSGLYANFTWNHPKGDEAQYDVTSLEDVYYIDKYYQANSGDLSNIFDQIFEQINSSAFTPIGGSNDAGVKDSLTYMDPIGEYMEIKDKGVTIGDKTYDMGLLLFEKMHGLVKTAIYDYSFNKDHLENGAFKKGWYDSTGNYKGENGSFEAGDTYYLDIGTARQYISILDEKEEDLTEQEKNTVYTIYRFAEDTDERNEDLLNPCYEKAAEVSYKLSDIRVWVEDTGDFEDEQGGGAIDLGYDQALYINIPTSALPIQTANISISEDGITYNTDTYYLQNTQANERVSDHVTPIRLFYGVGVDDEVMTADGIDIDVAKIDKEYVDNHTASDGVYFLSNYYSNTTYGGYVTDTIEGDRTRGDPNATFSPSTDNRYYLFQRPLVLYVADEVTSYQEQKMNESQYQEFLTKNKNNMVDERNDISSDKWYYVVLDYYTNTGNGKGEISHIAVTRKGEEFGSGISGDLDAGEFLVWYNLSNEEAPFEENTKPFNNGTKPTDDGNWVLATKPGGLRTGDMAQSLLSKTANNTSTSRNVNIPVVSGSTESSNIVIDNYLGNNGRIVIPNRLLEITKEVETQGGAEKTKESFDFEVTIEHFVGDHSAIDLIRNPYTKDWQLRISSIDVVTNNQGLLQTGDTENHSLAKVKRNGEEYYVYIGGNIVEGEDPLYHLYSASDGENPEELSGVGRTTYVDSLEGLTSTDTVLYKLASENNVLGSIDFWVKDAYLIPVKDVDDTEGWTWAENKNYRVEHNFVISHLDSTKIGTTQISSNYSTKTNYLTRTLIFGYDKEHPSPSEKPEGWTDEDWTWATNPANANKAKFSLKDGEGLGIVGIDDNAEYTVTEIVSQEQKDKGYEFDRAFDANGANSTVTASNNRYTVSGEVDALEEEHYVNHYRARYDLTLKKLVRGEDGDQSADWTFRIHLTPAEGEDIPADYSYDGSKSGTLHFTKNVEDGTYTSDAITLKHNESITLRNLISGTTYEIVEDNANLYGYETTVTEGDTYDPSEGVIDEDKNIEFVNANLAEQDLTIRKMVNGGSGDQNKTWTFDIYFTPANDVTLASSYTYNGSHSGEMTLEKQSDGTYKGTVSMKHNEHITINDLPERTKYKVVERGANEDGYQTTMTNAEGTLDNHQDVTVDFINTRYSRHELTIEKIVKGGAGDKEDAYWTFKVTFTPADDVDFEMEYPYKGSHTIEGVSNPQDGVLKLTDNKDGTYSGTIKLRHGQAITISNIPERTEYVVEELEANQDGYTTSVTDNAEGILTAEEETVTFTNTKYSYQDLTIEKEVTGDGDTNREWHFDVTFIPASGITLSNSYHYVGKNIEEGNLELHDNLDGSYTGRITLKHNQSLTIQNIPERTKYSIKEVEANQDGYLTQVTDNAEGFLPELVDSPTITVKYTNKKLPANTLTIAKEVLGGAGDKTKEWTFQVKFHFAEGVEVPASYPYTGDSIIEGIPTVEDGNLMLSEQEDGSYLATINLKHGQAITISDLPIGTQFEVLEVEADQDGYRTVTTGEITGTTDGEKAFLSVFSNIKSLTYDLTLSKIVSGHSGDKNRNWEFVITLTPAEYMTIASKYSYTGTKSGEISFTRQEDGSYVGRITLKHNDKITIQGIPENTRYRVVETEANQDGYITTVEGDTVGTLMENGTEITFTNTKLSLVDLKIKKLVKGNLGDRTRDWHFKITFTDPELVDLEESYTATKETLVYTEGVEEPEVKQEEFTLRLTKTELGNYEVTVTLKDGESITIKDLPETTKYAVTELEANEEGYITTYTENSEGILEEETEEVIFTNWKFSPAKLTIEKQLEGNDVDKDKEWNFEITLKPEDEYPIPQFYPYIGYGKENGFIEFTKMEDGTYKGLVSLKGGQKVTLEDLPYGLEYSVVEIEANKDRYKTTVTNGDGALVEEETEVVFVNKREIENPNTLDNISKYITLFVTSLVLMVAAIVCYFKKGSRLN